MAKRLSQLEYEHALQRERGDALTEPRAKAAHYNSRTNQVVVELNNGANFAFPTDLAQGLAGAADEDLDRIEVSPSGESLRWPTLDADFSLPELMRGVFGTRAWMKTLRRQTKKA